ncbi:calponin homology domain-containing protein [Lobosporangium transversale]|uniref:Calponin homology domain-containing protein n=1 Tax=Lobosporangium transversale TaxID=64571 RepID=A0A1Y2GWC3_9FUNG|nr:calponin homology domain-containing protein [Lobosporangium transversale]ORZ26598.1 calponin homology domain-containing protein [Lobosporangium transversale]|eukprot:XP_021884361.1 calponin homology domain-containing protein [Lobosporangium transversale]
MSDGVPLIQLLEVIGDTSLGRYNKVSRMRIQKVENVNKCLEFIRSRGVNLTNIGAEDIVDENSKLILGMIWTLILRFTIADISEEGLSAKEGLLLWCQRKTAPYREVNVRDFTYSWADGLAFCALIHRHRPDLLDFDSLDKSDRHGNTQLAFDVAEEHLDIPKLLDVEDVCDISKPDERSIMTYVAQYFHAFSELGKVDTAGRRVAKFAEVMESVWTMQNDYERRVKALMQAIHNKKAEWESSTFRGDYADAKRQSIEFNNYKTSLKRTWVAEKRDVDTLLGNIQTKLKTYELKPYHPPRGLTLQDLDNFWKNLLIAEEKRYRLINAKIRDIKEKLRQDFAKQANDFQAKVNAISHELTVLDGDLDLQLNHVRHLDSRLGPLADTLEQIQRLDDQCVEANIEENDYTIYSADDLSFDFALLEQAMQKKSAFISNQIVSRNMTNLTPGQLEEFESTFRYFDNNQTNSLSYGEFNAALASLGIMYEDEDFAGVFAQCSQGAPEVSFEQFINFMVGVTEDRTSSDQVRESFRIVAADKPFVTELDLRQSMLPPAVVSYLQSTLPRHDSGNGYNYEAYLDSVFK